MHLNYISSFVALLVRAQHGAVGCDDGSPGGTLNFKYDGETAVRSSGLQYSGSASVLCIQYVVTQVADDLTYLTLPTLMIGTQILQASCVDLVVDFPVNFFLGKL